ncbi:MAG: ankyrin repeat domain-containing protein [Nitrosomonas sp.]|nr:ankyrin repeat domain-containing protein [Nitrosomonas sp.]
MSYCGHSQYRRTDTVKLLIKREARIDVINNKGRTALSIAKEKGDKEIINFLVGCDIKN